MSPIELEGFLGESRGEIVAASAARMESEPGMVEMAAQRGMSAKEICTQIVGFWFDGIRSDLTLGTTAAMEQNMAWLPSFRSGHSLSFDRDLVHRFLAVISEEIENRLDAAGSVAEYREYAARVGQLIDSAFSVVEVRSDGR